MQPFSLFDIPEEKPEDELLDMLISQDSAPEAKGNGDLDTDRDGEDWDSESDHDYLSEDEDFQG
jgi:hypothetical protein